MEEMKNQHNLAEGKKRNIGFAVNLEKNRSYTLDITGMTHEGQGVGKIEGFTVFVDDALAGEQCEVKIIKVNKNYAVGKLISIIKPSTARVKPFCPAYQRCGGCSLQHMSYAEQLRYKTDLVKESIKRIGRLENVTVYDTIGMADPMYYRNKAQYPVSMMSGTAITGFYAKRSHEVIDSEECGIQDRASTKVSQIIRRFINDKKLTVYDEETGEGLVRHVVTRVSFKTGEVMAVVVVNGRELPYSSELVQALTGEMPEIKSIYLNVNIKKTNVILGEKNIKLYGSDSIRDYIGKYAFEISPLSFFQVNPVQTEVLYRKAMEYASLSGNETVFDLYCGIGTISLFLSEKAGKVYGVEVVEEAVKDARRNAELNNVKNAEFISGEAEKVIPDMYSKGIRADVVVVDPPRKGCDEALLETLAKMQPQRIVYVSCNPATLARDLKYLCENGYNAAEIQPVDMFPHTPHTECCVKIERT